ncbi:MAG: MlaD family protein, partial [Planctomycetota bacterium]
FFDPRYPITIRLPDAGGLTNGSTVTYRGIGVGQIRSISLDGSPAGVTITAAIRGSIDLPDDVEAQVHTSAFLGGSKLILAHNDDPSPTALPRDGSATLDGRVLSPLDSLGGEFAESLSGPMQRIGGLIERYDALAVEWREVAVNLRALTDNRSPDDVDAGTAEANFATLIARADARMAELKQAIEGVNRYVNDEAIRDDIKATVANARAMTDTGRETMQEVDATVASIRESVDALEKRYIAAADDLSQALNTATDVLKQARDGDGTAGKLLNDPAIYNNLNDAAERLGLVLRRLELLFEKWEDEGVEISF